MATYRHEWDLGAVSPSVSARIAMSILQSRPNAMFPFTVRGTRGETSIILASSYDLINTVGPLGNWGTGPDPVQVSAIGPLFFTFTTLAGHHRGAGQTISFECFERAGRVWLAQYGTYVSTWSHPLTTVFNMGANMGASGAWALQAHNLRDALGTAGSVEDAIIPGGRTVWPG